MFNFAIPQRLRINGHVSGEREKLAERGGCSGAVVSAYSEVGTVARQIVVVREDACELGNSNRKGSTHGGVGGLVA